MTHGSEPFRRKVSICNCRLGVEVLALLESKGIAAAGWPNDAREVMRSPQALSTYLQLDERARCDRLAVIS